MDKVSIYHNVEKSQLLNITYTKTRGNELLSQHVILSFYK